MINRKTLFCVALVSLSSTLAGKNVVVTNRSLTVANTNTSLKQSTTISNNELIAKLRVLVETGQFKNGWEVYLLLQQRKKIKAIPPEILLPLYYKKGRAKLFDKLLAKNPDLHKRPGNHRLIIALRAYDMGNFRSFFIHILSSLESIDQNHARGLRLSILDIQDKAYQSALRRLSVVSIADTLLIDRLKSYVLLKLNSFPEAYRLIRKLYAEKTTIKIKQMRLLFHLAIKTGNGLEAVYWGRQIGKIKTMANNHIYMNNFCIALSIHLRSPGFKKEKIQTELLQTVEKLLKHKRSANVLHTASICYESCGKLRKAVEMIRLCRALDPKNKAHLNRQRMLERKLKQKIKKARRLR